MVLQLRKILIYLKFSISLVLLWMMISVRKNNDESLIISTETELYLKECNYNSSRNISDYVFPKIKTTILEPRSLCDNKFFALIVVCSSVGRFDERQVIRTTWGNTTEFNYPLFNKIHLHMKDHFLNIKEERVKYYAEYLNLSNAVSHKFNISNHTIPIRVVFLIGKELNSNIETTIRIQKESEYYNDLIQEDFIDSYHNLTIKSVMMLKWILTKCRNSMRFVLKSDDDSFVNIPNLIHFLLGGTIPIYKYTLEFYNSRTVNSLSQLNRLSITENLLTGYQMCYVKPVKKKTNKWYVPNYIYNDYIYPTYISGAGYLMSYDVINKLYKTALNTPIIHLEDLYITGFCAEKIGLRRLHNPLFYINYNFSKKKCSYKGMVSQHLRRRLISRVYKFVINTAKQCEPPDKYYNKRELSRLPICKY